MSAVYHQLVDGPVTADRLIYAVGDIHGRLDALDALLSIIQTDIRQHAAADKPVIVFLGDYVDRGPQSRDVVETIVALQANLNFEIVSLKGNHEAALLRFLDDARYGPEWASYGGTATLLSYGVTPPRLKFDEDAWERAHEDFSDRLPTPHLHFLNALETIRIIGDFAFVHAGVRPGIPLEDQIEKDLIWMREPFLSSHTRQEKVIVHGHTPTEKPYDDAVRIGVDTGAYATGVLTAVRLEGSTRLFLQACVHAS